MLVHHRRKASFHYIGPIVTRSLDSLRRSSALLAVAALALSATACLRADVDVTVNSDRSGEIQVEVYPNAAVRSALEGTDVESLVEGTFEQVEGFEFSEIDRGERQGYLLQVPFDDYRDVTDVLISGGSVAGQQVTLFSSFALTELPDGGWELAATVNPIGKILGGTAGAGQSAVLSELLSAAAGSPGGTGLDLTVALPGEVTTSNADIVSGGSATWHLDSADAPTDLRMRTQPEPWLNPLVMVIGSAFIVVIIGVMLSLWGAGRPEKSIGDRARRRRHRSTESPAASWAPSPAVSGSEQSQRPKELPSLTAYPAAPAQQPPPGEPAPGSPDPAQDSPT